MTTIKHYLESTLLRILFIAVAFFALLTTSYSFYERLTAPIEIYIGIMSEEVSSLIKSSLDENTFNSSTLIISRTDIRPKYMGGKGELLEQALSLYDNDLEKEQNIAVTTDPSLKEAEDETDIIRQLAARIKNKTSDEKIRVEDYYIPGFKFKMGGKNWRKGIASDSLDAKGQAIISVARIGTGNVKRVFIQLPEMGFQSDLSYRYGEAILDSLAEQFPKKSIIFTTTFGAGGSVSEEVRPGETDQFLNSIGVRVYKIPGKDKYIGKLSISNFDGEKVFFATEPLDNPYKAQEIVRFAFLRLGDIPRKDFELSSTYVNSLLRSGTHKLLYKDLDTTIEKILALSKDEGSKKSEVEKIRLEKQVGSLKKSIETLEKTAEKEIIGSNLDAFEERIGDHRQEVVASLKDGQTSIAASFFLGELEKNAGNNIGKMISAAVENKGSIKDYANKKNPNVLSVNMEDDIVFRLYKHVMKSEREGKESFSLIRVSCDPFKIDKSIKTELHSWAREVEYDIDHYVDAIIWRLSGFDDVFLSKNAHWSFYEKFKQGPYKSLFYETRVTKNGGAPIVIDPFWREIGTDFLHDVLEKGQQKDETMAFRQTFEKLVNAETIHNLNLQEIGDLKKQLTDILKTALETEGLAKENNKYRVWVRIGSWSANTGNTLDTIDFEHGSNTDRAFYVSTNVSALIYEAHQYFKNLLKLQ